MPRTRTRRQRSSTSTSAFSPKVDAFGTVRVLGNEYKVRAIEYAPDRLALFRESDPTNPVTLELSTPIEIRGRNMRTTFIAEGAEAELVFQKAGCGCETPRSLRGGRNMLLEGAGLS